MPIFGFFLIHWVFFSVVNIDFSYRKFFVWNHSLDKKCLLFEHSGKVWKKVGKKSGIWKWNLSGHPELICWLRLQGGHSSREIGKVGKKSGIRQNPPKIGKKSGIYDFLSKSREKSGILSILVWKFFFNSWIIL